MCLVTLDFQSAFNNISHEYMYGVLRRYKYGTRITGAITSLYEHATSCVSINGSYTKDFQLGRSIRQGCPLSTLLYALAVNPFLLLIHKHMAGIRMAQQCAVACVAYADDITVIINNEKESHTLTHLIACYKEASGAKINWIKTKALPIGNWDRTRPLAGLRYTSEATILGTTFGSNISAAVESTWYKKLQQLHAGVRDQNNCRLDIQQRIWACNTWVLAKLWFAAQVLPITTKYTSTITSYITKII